MNTHLHADHITGTGYLKQLLPNVESVISARSGAKADKHLADGDLIRFGRHEIKSVSTPGHTSGCMTYISMEQVKYFGRTTAPPAGVCGVCVTALLCGFRLIVVWELFCLRRVVFRHFRGLCTNWLFCVEPVIHFNTICNDNSIMAVARICKIRFVCGWHGEARYVFRGTYPVLSDKWCVSRPVGLSFNQAVSRALFDHKIKCL